MNIGFLAQVSGGLGRCEQHHARLGLEHFAGLAGDDAELVSRNGRIDQRCSVPGDPTRKRPSSPTCFCSKPALLLSNVTKSGCSSPSAFFAMSMARA